MFSITVERKIEDPAMKLPTLLDCSVHLEVAASNEMGSTHSCPILWFVGPSVGLRTGRPDRGSTQSGGRGSGAIAGVFARDVAGYDRKWFAFVEVSAAPALS